MLFGLAVTEDLGGEVVADYGDFIVFVALVDYQLGVVVKNLVSREVSVVDI